MRRYEELEEMKKQQHQSGRRNGIKCSLIPPVEKTKGKQREISSRQKDTLGRSKVRLRPGGRR